MPLADLRIKRELARMTMLQNSSGIVRGISEPARKGCSEDAK
jgi:hypothetical protein